jgi:hypothetical protein
LHPLQETHTTCGHRSEYQQIFPKVVLLEFQFGLNFENASDNARHTSHGSKREKVSTAHTDSEENRRMYVCKHLANIAFSAYSDAQK